MTTRWSCERGDQKAGSTVTEADLISHKLGHKLFMGIGGSAVK